MVHTGGDLLRWDENLVKAGEGADRYRPVDQAGALGGEEVPTWAVDEVAVLISRHVDEPGEVPGEVGPPVHHEAAWSAHRGGWVDSDVGWVIPPGAAVV